MLAALGRVFYNNDSERERERESDVRIEMRDNIAEVDNRTGLDGGKVAKI
jgi:hypothetical protein